MSLTSPSRTIVGLEIEPGRLTAARAVEADGPLAVRQAATMALEPGVVRDGEVSDPEALTAALRTLFSANRLGKRVRVGVANQRVLVRTLDLPPLEDPKELAAAIRFQAQDHIAMPLEQAVLDHQSLGVIETPEGRRTRVVVVAARRDMVQRFVAAVRAAGLCPVGVDLSAFALVRALDTPREESTTRLFVSIGGLTTIALGQGGQCLFTRTVPGGVELLAQELAERRGLTLGDAHGWLTHVGLAAALEEIEGDVSIVTEAREVLKDGSRRIADEIRNSLDFYRTQRDDFDLAPGLLTGPATLVPGFADALQADSGLDFLTAAVAREDDGSDGVDVERLAIAAGLAVEGRRGR